MRSRRHGIIAKRRYKCKVTRVSLFYFHVGRKEKKKKKSGTYPGEKDKNGGDPEGKSPVVLFTRPLKARNLFTLECSNAFKQIDVIDDGAQTVL